MFRLGRLLVDTFAIDRDFPGKTFLISDQNFGIVIEHFFVIV